MYELSYEGLTGEIITRYDCEYEEARQEWNRAIQKFPLAIIYCFTKWDVSNAIIWARKMKLLFAFVLVDTITKDILSETMSS